MNDIFTSTFNLEGYNALIAISGLMIAGIIKGASGIGYASCALPFLTFAFGLKTAIAIVVLPALASNIYITLTSGYLKQVLYRFWPFYLATFPGIIIGIRGLTHMPIQLSETVLGALIVIYSSYAIFFLPKPITRKFECLVKFPAGLLNGFFTGLTGSQVMPLVPYILSIPLRKNMMIQAINLSVTLTSIFLIVALLETGIMTTSLMNLSIISMAPALFGVYVGSILRYLLPHSLFRKIVLFVLGLTGLLILIRSVYSI